METYFIPNKDFPLFVQSKGIGENVHLKAVDGKFRWVLKFDKDTEIILRPIPLPWWKIYWKKLKALL